ncbi:MAG: ATP-binding cassette domain-containing protein [Parachlamydiaceae bacterium]
MIILKNICKSFSSKKLNHQALANINIHIRHGETLGIVGESGSGKSTLGRVMLGLETPSSGELFFEGKELSLLSAKERRYLCKEMQMIFQDPYSSLNPRMTIEEIIGEGLLIHNLANGLERRERVASLIASVGLDPSMLSRYPHQFSGGQRQRICIARALAVEPRFIVCDEPLSALDIQTQRRILALLKELKRKNGLTFLFISHDLHAVRAIADNIAVMYQGKIVEYAPVEQLFTSPQHSYTKELLASVLRT